MLLTAIKVTYGVTVPYPKGSFSSVRPEVSLEAKLEATDNLEQSHALLKARVKALLMQEILDLAPEVEGMSQDLGGHLERFFAEQPAVQAR